MHFYKDEHQVYRVRPLDAFDWLIHGFGTRWSKSFGSCGNLATLRQIHSDRCVPAQGRTGPLGEGDALFDTTRGVLLGVKTADCIPLLLVDPERRAVAAVHAGWRGTVARIAARMVETLAAECGSQAADLHVAIGPGIGPCCFEVGPEVSAEFGLEGRRKLDLPETNLRQLIEAGVPPERIYQAGLCTVCIGDFFSYRREREQASRMLSVIGLR